MAGLKVVKKRKPFNRLKEETYLTASFNCLNGHLVEGLDGGGGGGYKCQLSVKILAICQLSVKFKAICQLSVNWLLIIN